MNIKHFTTALLFFEKTKCVLKGTTNIVLESSSLPYHMILEIIFARHGWGHSSSITNRQFLPYKESANQVNYSSYRNIKLLWYCLYSHTVYMNTVNNAVQFLQWVYITSVWVLCIHVCVDFLILLNFQLSLIAFCSIFWTVCKCNHEQLWIRPGTT